MARAAVPFRAGEVLTYDVKFGVFKVGTGTMSVVGTEDIRGREAWRTRFAVEGGIPGYRVNDRMESWFDTRTLQSLRFEQSLLEGGTDRHRHFEIFPERGEYTDVVRGETAPSVGNPLDEGAFLYVLRSLPLEPGRSYTFNRYFKPDRNPVTIRVLRRERVQVPAGSFDALVVQPVIHTAGIFSENGRAEVWITDDDRHLVVQLKSKLPFGSLNLYLRDYDPGR